MKKTLLILLVLLYSLSAYSQQTYNNISNNDTTTPKYSNGLDTLFMGIEYRDPKYFYGSNWADECIFNAGNQGTIAGYGMTIYPCKEARRIYTESPLTIIGIAVPATIGVDSQIIEYVTNGVFTMDQCYADTSVANRLPEYLQLYEATDTSFELVAQGRWDDPENKCTRRLELIDNPREGPREYIYAPIHEVYFDESVVVNDSFYVGVTNFNNVLEHDGETPTGLPRWVRYKYLSTMYYSIGRQYQNDPNGCHALGYSKVKFDPMEVGGPCYYQTQHVNGPDGQTIDTTRWYYYFYYDNFFSPIIFPIIDTTNYYLHTPDTCANVSDFGLVRTSTSYATFSWSNAEGHTAWEMAYGTEGTPLENCTIVNTPYTVHCITHLDSGQWYIAYVRAVCDNKYSEWSDSIRFYIAGDTAMNIQSSNLEEYTYIIPNPAQNIANIYSSYTIRKIEIFSLNGVIVKEDETNGITTTMDVSSLAKGTYLVKIHTIKGIATKKLVIN